MEMLTTFFPVATISFGRILDVNVTYTNGTTSACNDTECERSHALTHQIELSPVLS